MASGSTRPGFVPGCDNDVSRVEALTFTRFLQANESDARASGYISVGNNPVSHDDIKKQP